MIYIIGLGPNNSANIKENIKNLLLNNTSAKIIARTKEHPAIEFLQNNDIAFETCDRFYTENDNFENTYNQIASYISNCAKNTDVMYLVPGHPMVAELTTQLLIKSNETVKVIGGESFLDSCFNAAKFDPVEGFSLLDATNHDTLKNINQKNHILITQCYDDITAANISDKLMNYYPYDYEITIIEQAGAEDEKIYTTSLNELSATVGENVNNLRAVYIPPYKDGISFNIQDYTLNFDENNEVFENNLNEKLKNLVNELKTGEDNTKTLAKIINTTLDFTTTVDAYYEISSILEEMKKDRQDG
ncbi:SAM-dependent methyltransferase [Gemella cuniculi]|uniref:SAM-dependent methyltransferase n=1 Tax=Gemella cuniculi TaxID=150240 RepID=UPI00041D40E0|nr:SAM-dependent methyltransferase [Gemella cuniculi]